MMKIISVKQLGKKRVSLHSGRILNLKKKKLKEMY